ncbi:YraN family protein [Anaerosalibacter bizertensis]|uniref:UPF0102 protein FYJ27_09200 n=1 Tax=Anaerosalibacter bizertensis TaxID=932217 RepID=A0A844FIW4_9FIRM|nr:YraN family protein [Anaerosalibacter bizertensis]MBV1816566.1 YraN family protein [Bacteroidales bacterium MSK.15.36]HHV27220.1 YraN family protein [Tissierellia bacterium]MBU5293312.1 YraN family protein [Anaerosalibacter bizertensis]MCB5558630.1 YraN family protein [Anaerosalibacter bizertensis]MCG4563953.1 YraN family protein [Anaerosalibacter bizertensis]
MSNHIDRGKIGESIAVNFLIGKDYYILERNFRSKTGEIDIIALKGDMLIFVEVKTRTSIDYGYAYEAVNRKKQRRIMNTAFYYIKFNRMKGYQLRFDIIEVYLGKIKKINHYENAFV